MTSKRGVLLLITALLIALMSLGYWWLTKVLVAPSPDLGGGDVEISIPKGASLQQVATLLADEKLVTKRGDFIWAARLMRAERKLQPGRFLLPRGVSNTRILRFLLQPSIDTVDITIPEGLTVCKIAGVFHSALNLDSSEFVRLCEDSIFAAGLGVRAGRLEGYIFPETYNFYQDDDCVRVLRRMVGQFFKIYNDSLKSKLSAAGLTLHQAVTLASIVQGEVVMPSEAPLVAAVYHNRLRMGMPLAADPTIQYILPGAPRRLLLKDLELDSPYNTYKHAGLPPGPINNPGRVALTAAVNPAKANYIYFVAVGDGSHAFSSNYNTFLRDKEKFQRVRREVARKLKNER